ncbi:[protein-PII] uridylyltransferase [Allostreptomyces psammosilenae]|uniref:Bifunctional uridylyltransferase/uridylyl-removing enzyme n=1 Tax=Allostreptomyces psammosilenae TaxID=1892865 RepID=A0A852ZW63_9ACTN|nr:[protein-PII] uridylyltransferase [Allostreptomyces psammosilenae]NYI06616.1 [protein-PII] uridylyltransferase [Allostreptomyces psammosilenae]
MQHEPTSALGSTRSADTLRDTPPTAGAEAAPTPTPGDPAAATAAWQAARDTLLATTTLPGATRRQRLSALTDDWLAHLLRAAVRAATPRDGRAAHGPRVALAAVGGHGRRALSPRSDLDLVLLHDGTLGPDQLTTLAEAIWYPIWDAGTALDHSVRTPREARAVAAENLKTQLGMLDLRHVAGDDDLTAELRGAVLADWRAAAPRRLPELREMGRERALRHGDLAFLLEPDLKEARGGLRDVVVLDAVAATWIADAPRDGLAAARDRLLDVRDALHLVTGRGTDRLVLQEQDAVADRLGVLDADALLRTVSESARAIAWAEEVTWREVERVVRGRRPGAGRLRRLRMSGQVDPTGGGATRRPLAHGVVEEDGEAVLARGARPERDPLLLLRAAAAAAQAGIPLSRHAVARLARECPPLPVPWPREARDLLVALLGSGEALLPVWEALEAEHLIGRLLPDWERVRCRPQRNAVHLYTVDRHLVQTAVHASALTRRVARPDLLLVVALLHDMGKGWPGDHSVAGRTIAVDLAARMGFDPVDAELLGRLVRHHLLLVDTATRRDPEDPATVATLTAAVRTPEELRLLHALTEADALATGPAAWGGWREALVEVLVDKVEAALTGQTRPGATATGTAGTTGPAGASGAATELTAEQRRAVEAVLASGGPVVEVAGPSPESVEDAEEDGPPLPGIEVTLAAPDRPGLLALAAGVLALHRLTVRSAVLAGVDGVAVQTWTVATGYGRGPAPRRLTEDLGRALDGRLDVTARLAERDRSHPVRRGARVAPPRVVVAPGAATGATVLEVRAHDRPGLLHRVGLAFAGHGLDVRQARVSTLGAEAVDAFYVVDDKGAPLTPRHAAAVARAVEAELSALAGD